MKSGANTDARAAAQVINDAFETRALITQLFADYVFITDGGGVDIYFHCNRAARSSKRYKLAPEMRFDLSHGEMIPQARTVHLVGTGGLRL